jgi:hypothetical protein
LVHRGFGPSRMARSSPMTMGTSNSPNAASDSAARTTYNDTARSEAPRAWRFDRNGAVPRRGTRRPAPRRAAAFGLKRQRCNPRVLAE